MKLLQVKKLMVNTLQQHYLKRCYLEVHPHLLINEQLKIQYKELHLFSSHSKTSDDVTPMYFIKSSIDKNPNDLILVLKSLYNKLNSPNLMVI